MVQNLVQGGTDGMSKKTGACAIDDVRRHEVDGGAILYPEEIATLLATGVLVEQLEEGLDPTFARHRDLGAP